MVDTSSILISRELGTSTNSYIQFSLTANQPCRAQVIIGSRSHGEFLSRSPLPPAISASTLHLVQTGRLRWYHDSREFEVFPLAVGGGCCNYRELQPEKRTQLPPVPQLNIETLEVKQTAEFEEAMKAEGDAKDLFAAMETEGNFNVKFLGRNLEVLYKKVGFDRGKDDLALKLLRKVLVRVFLASGAGTRPLQAKEVKVYTALLEQYISENPLPPLTRTSVELLVAGLSQLVNFRGPEEIRREMTAAFEVLLGKSTTVPNWVNIASPVEFTDSAKVEIYFVLIRAGALPSISPLNHILSKQIRAGHPYAFLLIEEIADFLLSLAAWQPALEVLFAGDSEVKGLEAYLLNQHNKELSETCTDAFQRLEKSSIPELSAIAAAALKKQKRPKASYLLRPLTDLPKSAPRSALLVDTATASFRILESPYFNARSRMAFNSPHSVVITGLPSSKDGKCTICVEINLDSMETTALPDLLRPRYWHTASYVAGQVIVAGGKSSKAEDALALVDALDLSNSTWTPLREMNYRRNSHSDCVIGSVLYIFGGGRDKESAASIEKFAGGVWTQLGVQMPIIAALVAVAAVSDTEVLLAGGNSTANECLCLILNFETGESTELPNLPEKSEFVSGMSRYYDQRFFFLSESRTLLQLDLAGRQWTEVGRHQP